MLTGYANLFTEEDLVRMYEAALDVLLHTGVRVHHDALLDRLGRFGVVVDKGTQTARFPRELVEDVVRTERGEDETWEAPPPADERVGIGNEEPFYYDWTTQTKRRATRDDLTTMFKLGEVLDEVGSMGAALTIADVDAKMEVLVNRALLMEYTGKPISCPQVLCVEQLKYLVELAEIYSGEAGDTRWIRTAAHSWFVSPLQLGAERCRCMLAAYDDFGLREFHFGSQAISGLNAPVTRAATIVLVAAELLGGAVIAKSLGDDVKLSVPGHSVTAALDMRTGRACFSCPEAAVQDAGVCQLFRHLFNRRTGAGSSNMIDAKIPGSQAIHDKMFLSLAWGGMTTRYCSHAGILDQGMIFSPTQLMLDLELNGAIGQYLRGVEVSDGTICLDLIEEIAHADEQNYLTAEHTLENFERHLWTPELLDRTPYQEDQAERERENRMLDVAEAKWRQKVSQYEKPKMPASEKRAIEDVLERARREFGAGSVSYRPETHLRWNSLNGTE